MYSPGFRSPTPEMFQEMIETNVSLDKTAIDLSVVPKLVLEQVVHTVLSKSFREASINKIDLSLGPDDFYHHEVQGLAVVTPDDVSLWVQHPKTKTWFAAAIDFQPTAVMPYRLIEKDGEEEWDIMSPGEADDSEEEFQWLLYTALTYIKMIPVPSEESLGFVTE